VGPAQKKRGDKKKQEVEVIPAGHNLGSAKQKVETTQKRKIQ
jgi:hypothetical protein